MGQMQAAVFRGDGVLEVTQMEIPNIQRPDQVLLKILAASICGTDLHALSVPPGQVVSRDIVLGHEFFGEIVEKGEDVKGFSIGDRVAVNPCMPCGECPECKRDMRNLCVTPRHYGMTCDGGFAQYALVESSQIYLLPRDVDPDIAAQTEPLACVMYSLGLIRFAPTDRVLLYGAGPIGLTFIKALQACGFHDYAVVAKGAARIEEARKCGAEFVIESGSGSVKELLLERWGERPDIVVDAVGRGAVLTEASNIVASRGRILLFGLDNNARSEVSPGFWTDREITVTGAHGKDFPASIGLIRAGIDLRSFISHRVSLGEINEAIRLLREKKACRVIVYPNGKDV